MEGHLYGKITSGKLKDKSFIIDIGEGNHNTTIKVGNKKLENIEYISAAIDANADRNGGRWLLHMRTNGLD